MPTSPPRPISNAGNSGHAAHIAQLCDRFDYEANLDKASAMWDNIWRILTGPHTWTANNNPLHTYQFYVDNDPFTNWGRAFRYTGFAMEAGPIRSPMAIVGTGIYTAPDGATFQAMILQTWDVTYWEMIVVIDDRNFAHLQQHFNGLPLVLFYSY